MITYTQELMKIIKKKKGLSDYKIAQLIRATPQKVSNWRTGQSEASVKYLLKLMYIADMGTDEMIYHVDSKIDRQYADESIRILQGGFSGIYLLTGIAISSLLILLNNTAVKEALIYIIRN